MTAGSVPKLGATEGHVAKTSTVAGSVLELQRLQHCQHVQLSGSGTLQSSVFLGDYQSHSRPAPNILPGSQDPAVARR